MNILMVTWGCKKWLTANITLGSILSKTTKLGKRRYLQFIYFDFIFVQYGMFRFILIFCMYTLWHMVRLQNSIIQPLIIL